MSHDCGAEGECGAKGEHEGQEPHVDAGNQILAIVSQNTESPAEALFLLNQLCLYLWDHYQLDWKGSAEVKLADSRKQRYLDFIGEIIDSLDLKDKPKGAI